MCTYMAYMVFINMTIHENYSLRACNTFGIDVRATRFCAVESVVDIWTAIKQNAGQLPLFMLGGGSNLLLRDDLPFFVLKNEIRGIEIVEEDERTALVAAGGGENWHEFVLWCIAQGLGGVENLSLIPGTVGAAPIQNIGAYGVELKDVFERLEAVHLSTGGVGTFDAKTCRFGYRDSVFKRDLKGKYAITKVFFRLQKKPAINSSYGAIARTLAAKAIENPTIKDVSDAVIEIRSSKLPDPAEIGNSGSFFKNPEISRATFEAAQARFPDIVHYDLPDGRVKVPAGWLIEQCGWKGKRVGNTGAYKNQALVLVNYGNASGAEVWALAQEIAASVEEKFGIRIVPEVNVLP